MAQHDNSGLPDTASQESRDRVQTAVKNTGLHFTHHRVVVNLAPATVRKEGPSYDLPIALGVIVLAGFLPHDKVENTMVIGELSLDGVVRHARGVLPMAATARANGFKRMFVPEVDAPEDYNGVSMGKISRIRSCRINSPEY